jgi:integrase
MATIVKVQGKKGVTWKVVIRRKGTDTITETFRLKTDAVAWANKTEAAIRDGEYHETRESQKKTMAEMIERYCRDFLTGKSTADTRIRLEWWKRQIGHMKISAVKPSVVLECRDKLKNDPIVTVKVVKGKEVKTERPRNVATCNRYMAALSTAFTTATKEMQWAKSNPVAEISSLREAKGRVRFLDDGERERILEACKASDNQMLLPIVTLALSTGMRKGEILGLTWSNVDMDGRRITLVETKNGTTRVLPITSKAYEVLDGLKRAKVRRIDTDLVFPGQNAFNTGPASIRTAWVFAVKRAELVDFRFHDLRHSCASYLAMNGCSLLEIAAILGHKTLAMVQRYAHLSEVHTHNVLEKMNNKILS